MNIFTLMITQSEQHIVNELDNSLLFKKHQVPVMLLVKPRVDTLLLQAFSDWLLILVFYSVFVFCPFWSYPVFALLIGSRYHSLGVILHDVTHMPLRIKTHKYRLLEVMTGYPIGSTINAMRYHHLRHHKDSGMVTDPYFKKGVKEKKYLKHLFIIKAVVLALFWTFRGIYGTLAFYLPTMRTSYAKVFLQDKSNKEFRDNAEVIQCAAEDRWQLLFHLCVYSMLWWAPSVFLYMYLFPVMISGIFAGYRLMNEHNYEPTTDRKIETIISTTNDHHLKGILKFFLAPKNIGYHIVHHLHPQVAWYKLPELRDWYLQNHHDLYTANLEKKHD